MKNIFFLLLSVIAMSMFTFASCENENDEPQPQTIESGYDTFRYEVKCNVNSFMVWYLDSTKTFTDTAINGNTNWVYEFRVEKPYTAVLLSLNGGDECTIYMNGEPLNIVPKYNGQLDILIKGSLYPYE